MSIYPDGQWSNGVVLGSGTKHPGTVIRYDAQGYPDFRPVLPDMPKGKYNTVQIELTGNRSKDYSAADAAAGIDSDYRLTNGLTWHHNQDLGIMQLVPTDVHGAVSHSGGVNFYNAANVGPAYAKSTTKVLD